MVRVAADILLPARGRFDLVATVDAGPRPLGPPWVWRGGSRPVLRRAERLYGRRAFLLEVRPAPGGVVLRAIGPGTTEIEQLAPLAARIRRALQLDVDLGPFHRRCHADPALRWIARAGLGRVVRGTTPFEDCLVALLGGDGLAALLGVGARCAGATALRACPSARDLAVIDARGLRARTGLDARAAAVVRLARAVVRGAVDLRTVDERAPLVSRAALLRMLRRLPGASAHTTAVLAPLLGHHEHILRDQDMLRDAARILLPGAAPTWPAIRRRLRGVTPWAGLAFSLCAARGARSRRR
jgi:hypothetical protein